MAIGLGYNGGMFFVLVCIIVVSLLANKITPDTSGWMMIVGAAWMAGFLDCRLFARSDKDAARVLPADVREGDGQPIEDRNLFAP